MKSFYLAFALLGASLVASDDSASPNSTVTLSYATYAASNYNTEDGYFAFYDIRFAAEPTGTLRFSPPQKPSATPGVQVGNTGRQCIQSAPLSSTGGSLAAALEVALFGTEDCLFLDVYTSSEALNTTESKNSTGKPVLVWIYGGGYVDGSKNSFGQFAPTSLLEASESEEGMVFVAFNYRLGAFGWLAGPTVNEYGVSNAGLYDQRFALEWVQDNIEKFGGDPKRVTVMGESAGAGSIMHQITAFGGEKGAPFHQALPQSPAWNPQLNQTALEEQYELFLRMSNCDSFECIQKANVSTLRVANAMSVATAKYGSGLFGPAVDGNFVPDSPGYLLKQGRFVKNISMTIGHNADEGPGFTKPNATLLYLLSTVGLTANQTVIDATMELYNISAANTTLPRDLAVLLVSESIFTCNTFYLASANHNLTWNYEFAIPPAIHGEDVEYTFYNPNVTTPFATPEFVFRNVSSAMDDLFANFVSNGDPNVSLKVHNNTGMGNCTFWPRYGDNSTVLFFNYTGLRIGKDPAAVERCNFWQNIFSAETLGLPIPSNTTCNSTSNSTNA